MSPNATGPSSATSTPEQGRQVSRAPLTTLSLLLVAAAVQLTAVVPLAARWLIVAALLLLAFISATLTAISLRKLDPILLNDLTKERDTVPGIITYYVTRSFWITIAITVGLLAGSGGSAYWSYHVWRPPIPSGEFITSRHGSLSSFSGQYLVSLRNVQNMSSDLVWIEVAVPQYTAPYAQTYLYYYTQASPRFESTASYDVIADIANYAEVPVKEILTAFACNGANTVIEPGASHSEVRKQAGCYNLAHICVLLPPCQRSPKCTARKDVFAQPPECGNQPSVSLEQVATLP